MDKENAPAKTWDKYEVAKLIELRERLSGLSATEQDKAVAELSKILIAYRKKYFPEKAEEAAQSCGIVRLRVALARLENVFSDGLLGIPTDSELILELVREYREERENFNALLSEADRLMDFADADESAATNGDELDAYEITLLLAAYDELSKLEQIDWDASMEKLARRLNSYQLARCKGNEAAFSPRDLESLADKVFMLRLLYAGADPSEVDATDLEKKIFSLRQHNAAAFAGMLAEAEARIPRGEANDE